MQEQVNVVASAALKRVPWNKGKLTGAKPPLRPKTSGQFGRNSRSKAAFATSQCSIWRSTASFAAAMSSLCGSKMLLPADTLRIEQWSDRENRSAR